MCESTDLLNPVIRLNKVSDKKNTDILKEVTKIVTQQEPEILSGRWETLSQS